MACALLTAARSGLFDDLAQHRYTYAITSDDRGQCLHVGTACVPGHRAASIRDLLRRLEVEPALRMCTCATSSWAPWTRLPSQMRLDVLALATWQAARVTAAPDAAPDLRVAHRCLLVHHDALEPVRAEVMRDVDAALVQYLRGPVWASHRREAISHRLVKTAILGGQGEGRDLPGGASALDAAVWVVCQPRSSALRALAGTTLVGSRWDQVATVGLPESPRVVGLTDLGSAAAVLSLTGGVAVLCGEVCVCGSPATCRPAGGVEEVGVLVRCADRWGLSVLEAREVLSASCV